MKDQLIEEALSIVWEALETQIPDFSFQNEQSEIKLPQSVVKSRLESRIDKSVYSELLVAGYIAEQSDQVRFTSIGLNQARNIIRRQRLAERLLVDILDRPKGEVISDACEFEHIISSGVEESICVILGHPRECPHGSPIPVGSCCTREQESISSIVVSLGQLKSGESARIVYLSTQNHPEMHRLLQIGIIPGQVVRIHQTYPSIVIQVDQTQIAMATETAGKIFVRREGK